MNKMIKKLILFILIFIVLAIGISILKSLKDQKEEDYKSDTINKSNARALEIYNRKVTNLSERSSNDITALIKIKNIAEFDVSQIVLYYDELDKNNKVISDSKMNMDITLSPLEVMRAEFTPKDYTETIEITGYSYIVEDCRVNVNLKDNSTKIIENKEYLENSKSYEVMSIKKDESKKDDSTFSVNIKNISQKNLGNIILKVAEINKENEIVKFDHIIYNSILKPEEEGYLTTTLSDSQYSIKILGYTYDDMENKSNINIDLITHKVNIIDNKE